MSKRKKAPEKIEPICIECGRLAVLTPASVVYPHRSDLHGRSLFVCACGARVGCHPGTTEPLGLPAGPETSRARDKAHRAFDPLWKRKAEKAGASYGPARRRAYGWLARELGIDPGRCHISWFDRPTCERVVAICQPYADRIALAQRRESEVAYARDKPESS